MYIPLDEKEIDQKIHQFMVRKSPLKSFSKAIVERLSPAGDTPKKIEKTEIPYEKLSWHHTGEPVFHSRFQRAH